MAIAIAQGTQAGGQKGQWETNPTTGLVQFFPEGTEIKFDSPLTLPNLPQDSTQPKIGSLNDLGISSSLPAVNKEDIKRQTQEEFASTRGILERRREQVIQEARETGAGEQRALEGELGTRRRFSSSARAFIEFIGDKNAKKIAELELQRDEALANFDVKLAELTQTRIKDEQSTQQKEFENIMKLIEVEQKQTKTGGATLSDTTVSNFLKQGITDKNEIFRQAQLQGINVSADDINKSLDNLSTKPSIDNTKLDFKFDNASLGALLSDKVGFSGEEVQILQDTLNKNGLYGKNENGISLKDVLTKKQFDEVNKIINPPPKTGTTTGSKAGDLDYNTGTLVVRLGKMIYGTRIANEESERVQNFVTQGQSLGKSEYEILDDVIGFKVTRNKGLADGLRDIIIANADEDGVAGFDMLGTARLINSGNDLAAIRKVENNAVAKYMKEFGKDDVFTEDDVLYTHNKVTEINKLLGEGFFDNVGAFTGSIDNFLARKFGFGQSIKIMAKLNSITADLINKRAGSNVTEAEWDRLIAPSVPQKNESPSAWRDKLEELVSNPLNRYNSTRQIALLPNLTINEIVDPNKRIRKYIGNQQKEFNDFIDASNQYNSQVWEKVQ